jgi:tight adherence protein B
MANSFAANSYLVILILVFVSVLMFLRGLYLFWNEVRGPAAQRLETRLQSLSSTFVKERDAVLIKQAGLSEVASLEALLRSLPVAHRLQTFIDQSGLSWSVARLLLTGLVSALIAYIAATVVLHQSWLTGIVASAAGFLPPLGYVALRRRRRLSRLERQLPEALDLINRALRAGHAFSAGLQMIGEEMMEPIAGEFRIVCDEINFGVSLQQALLNLNQRIPLTDLRYFIVAVLIQRESGGNLTEILSNLARLIRERLKFLTKVKILSSEGRLSAWVLVAMPFAIAALLKVFNPEFMSPLWKDPIGISIIKTMLGLMAVGIAIMYKIVRIRV